MTKSQKIQEYKAANPKASATEIQAALKKEKIKVSMPLIYQVFAKKRKGRKTAGGPKSNGEVSVETLLEAKKVVAQVGSIEDARKALDLLAKLTT